jgi:hypothetical protein
LQRALLPISNLPLAALLQLTCSRATTVSYKRAVPIEANRRDNFAVTPKIMRVLAVAAWVAAGNWMPAWVHAEPVAAAPSTAKLERLSEFFEQLRRTPRPLTSNVTPLHCF